MKITEIKSCYIGPKISPEQFIPEHFFIYLIKGSMEVYDGSKQFIIHAGDFCIVKKNYLLRYSKQKIDGEFEKVVLIFDEDFLKKFMKKHYIKAQEESDKNPIYFIKPNELITNFLTSLELYYDNNGEVIDTFSNIKREELLLILLYLDSNLSNTFFNFKIPEKKDIERFMKSNYKFNVSLERFAYLTGRSLSTFRRDFYKIFNTTPQKWLLKRRLEEAHFLIEKEDAKPSEIFFDLGFNDLSHFSYAFKKYYGYTMSQLINKSIG